MTLPDYVIDDPALDRLSREELERLQGERLRAMVAYVYERSGFWRRKLDEAGVEPQDIRGAADLSSLPFTTRAELNADQAEHPPFGDYVCSPPESWTWLFTTSGTSGRKLKRLLSRRDWELYLGFFKRRPVIHAGEMGFILAPIDGLAGPTAAVEGTRRAGALPILAGLWDTRTKVQMIRELRPAVLAGVPSYAVYMSEVAAEMGVDLSRCGVRSLLLLGEPGASIPSTRMTLERRYGTGQIIDGYGLSELWPFSSSCPHSTSLHVLEDYLTVECVDPQSGQPVPEGEPGELVYTNLIGDTQPLLRYRSRDIGRLIRSAPCACGFRLARIARIEGRADDMIWYRGINFFPSAVEEIVRGQEGLSPEYLIVVDEAEGGLPTLTIQVEALHEFSDEQRTRALRTAVTDQIRGGLGVTANIEVLPLGALPRTEGGKARRVVDRRQEVQTR